MSTANTKNIAEDTFASKLGIEMVTTRTFQELIELNAGTRTVVCAIGDSGIGKTAIPMQIAKQRNGGKGVPYVALHMPTATQEGFFIPTTAADTKQYFDQRVPRLFQPLIEWATAAQKKYKGKVPKDQCPILAIEELNRAVDKSVTRAAFVLIGDRMIGDIPLPDCIQIVVTMNPSGGGMSVNEFERDPAMSRRLLKIGVTYNYGDFMQHAQSAGFHPHVLAHLGAQPSHGYDMMAALAGKAFACPATWETVSRLCEKFEEAKVPLASATGRAAIAGAVGVASATAFLDFVRDNTAVVTPDDVLTSYSPGSAVRTRFQAYLPKNDGGRLDKISELTMGLATRIFSDLTQAPDERVKALALFISDLPEDAMMAFIQKLTDEAARLGSEARAYLQKFNEQLAKEPVFTEALKRLHHAKVAAQKGAQA